MPSVLLETFLGGNSDSTSSHHPVFDYFPPTGCPEMFHSLLKIPNKSQSWDLFIEIYSWKHAYLQVPPGVCTATNVSFRIHFWFIFTKNGNFFQHFFCLTFLLSCPDGLNPISVIVTLFIYFVGCSFEKSQTKHIKFHVGKKNNIFLVLFHF